MTGTQDAAVGAALLILERMGLSPDDLSAVPRQRPDMPTFAAYIPVVSAQVTAGTRKTYGSYWNRITDQWGGRRLDEPTPSQIRAFMLEVKSQAVVRRTSRGGRSAAVWRRFRCPWQPRGCVGDGVHGADSAGS
jgi:integrase/recombinase XerC